MADDAVKTVSASLFSGTLFMSSFLYLWDRVQGARHLAGVSLLLAFILVVSFCSPVCGATAKRYDARLRTWRHLGFSELQPLLTAGVPRMPLLCAERTSGSGSERLSRPVRPGAAAPQGRAARHAERGRCASASMSHATQSNNVA